jgi:hypothetical protein
MHDSCRIRLSVCAIAQTFALEAGMVSLVVDRTELNMQKPPDNISVAATAPSPRGRVCARCHGEIYPLKRGLFDLIRGHGSMLYRYQCDSYRCSDREQEDPEQSLNGHFSVDMAPISRGRDCPRCQGATFRAERTLIDLLISRVSVVHRYQCDSRRCGWSGTVRQNQRANSTRN